MDMHLPNLNLIWQSPIAIQIHLLSILLVIALTFVQLFGKKGTGAHRIIGWTWVILMLIAAISSFFIQTINKDGFSLIHLLSVLTLISLPQIVYFARKGDVKRHQRTVLSLIIGGLLIAGIFTFTPGRLMWRLFFG